MSISIHRLSSLACKNLWKQWISSILVVMAVVVLAEAFIFSVTHGDTLNDMKGFESNKCGAVQNMTYFGKNKTETFPPFLSSLSLSLSLAHSLLSEFALQSVSSCTQLISPQTETELSDNELLFLSASLPACPGDFLSVLMQTTWRLTESNEIKACTDRQRSKEKDKQTYR